MSYIKGQWNIICDVCGWEFKSGQIKKRWDGLLVCEADFEYDHPQKYIRGRADPKPVPHDWIRPEPEDNYIGGCTSFSVRGIAGYGKAGCMIAGKLYG